MTRPTGRPRPRLPVWWAGFASVLAGYAITAILVGVMSLVVRGGVDDASLTLVGTYLQDAVFFIVALVTARVLAGADALGALGWRSAAPVGPAALKAVCVVAVFYAVSAGYATLTELQDASDGTVDALGLRTSTVRLVFSVLLLTVVAPIVEETMFRGLLFGALWRWRGWLFGAVVSGIVFGGIHVGGAPAAALPVLAGLGFALAALYRWTGSLLPSIGVHALNNAVTLGTVLEWQLEYCLALIVVAPAVAVLIAYTFTAWPGSSAINGPPKSPP